MSWGGSPSCGHDLSEGSVLLPPKRRRGKVHLIDCSHDDKTVCGIKTNKMNSEFSIFPEVINCKKCKRTKIYLERKYLYK